MDQDYIAFIDQNFYAMMWFLISHTKFFGDVLLWTNKCFIGCDKQTTMFCWMQQRVQKMAEAACDIPITFDILNGLILENDVNLIHNFTE